MLNKRMKRKGVGSVVAVSLLILLGITLVSVLIGVFIKNIDKATKDESALCLGIDLKVKDCIIFNVTDLNNIGTLFSSSILSNQTHPGILANVERLPGGGEYINGLKLVVTDSSGRTITEETVNIVVGPFSADNDYKDLVEYNSNEVVVLNLTYISNSNPWASVTVAALVGESRTTCQPIRPAVVCGRFS